MLSDLFNKVRYLPVVTNGVVILLLKKYILEGELIAIYKRQCGILAKQSVLLMLYTEYKSFANSFKGLLSLLSKKIFSQRRVVKKKADTQCMYIIRVRTVLALR